MSNTNDSTSSNLIPAGRYDAIVDGAEPGMTKNGADQVVLALRIDGGEHDGRVLPKYCYLSDAALPWTMKTLWACGFKGNDLSELTSVVGALVSITVEHDEYEGVVRNKVAWVNERRSFVVNKLDESSKASFADRYRAKVAAMAAAANPQIDEDDDIPFNV